jgi:Flp pilus assembly pilin Flp
MVRLLQAWLWLREKGQGLVEYALILVLIAVVVIVVLSPPGHPGQHRVLPDRQRPGRGS